VERTSVIFFWAAVAAMAVGFFDRVTINSELFAGVAPGSYWKAGIAFLGFSLAAGQLAGLRPRA
jgi:hypothetical protein